MYQLFLPNQRGQNSALLQEIDCGNLVPGAEFCEGEGPEGQRGVFIAWRRIGQRADMGYQPARQDWFRSLCGRYWFGLWTDRPLTAELLARPETQDGPRLTLGNGEQWMVPSLDTFPRVIVSIADDQVELRLTKRWDAHGRRCLAWRDRLVTRAQQEIDAIEEFGSIEKIPEPVRRDFEPMFFPDMYAFAVEALAINYRVRREIVDRLELITTNNVAGIVQAACGLPIL
jgi:hypothetical protein